MSNELPETESNQSYVAELKSRTAFLGDWMEMASMFSSEEPQIRAAAFKRRLEISRVLRKDENRKLFIELADFIRRNDSDETVRELAKKFVQSEAFEIVEAGTRLGDGKVFETYNQHRHEYAPDGSRLTESDKLVRLIDTENVERIKIAQKEYDFLASEYGVNVIESQVFASNPGYMVVRKVHGEAISDSPEKKYSEVDLGLIEDNYAKLLQYVFDRVKEEKPFLNDLYQPDQYVIGHVSDETARKLWLVDIDPYYCDSKEIAEESARTFANALETVLAVFAHSGFKGNPSKVFRVAQDFLEYANSHNFHHDPKAVGNLSKLETLIENHAALAS